MPGRSCGRAWGTPDEAGCRDLAPATLAARDSGSACPRGLKEAQARRGSPAPTHGQAVLPDGAVDPGRAFASRGTGDETALDAQVLFQQLGAGPQLIRAAFEHYLAL